MGPPGDHGRRHRRRGRVARVPGLPEARGAGAETLRARTLKRRLAWAFGGLALAVTALIVAAPALIDIPAVQAEIQRRLSRALGGQVSWQAMDVRLLPAPHGELRDLRIEIARISAAADEVNVYLRLWPLLWGQPEISSVNLKRPRIRIAPGDAGASGADAFPDVVALYRAALAPAARALREFAPDTTLRLEEAAVDLGAGFALRDLRASARTDSQGVELELAAASNLWKRLSVEARVEYSDLAANGAIALDGLSLDKDVPAAAMRARIRTDARTSVECEFDGSVGTLVPAVKGKLLLPAGKPPELAAELTGVDVAQALAIARTKGAPLDVIESAEGKVSLTASMTLEEARLRIEKSDAAVKLAPLPWKLSPRAAQVTISRERVSVAALEGFAEKSTFSGVAADIDLGKKRVASASGRATLELAQWFPWLQGKLPLEQITSLSGTVDVVLNRFALPFDRPRALDFDALATPRKASIALKALPMPVQIAGGSVHADAKRVRGAGLRGTVGNSEFSNAAFQVELGAPARVSAASGAARIRLEQWFPWLQARLPLDEIASLSGSAEVTLNRLALRFDRPAEADFDAVATPGKVSVALNALPAPVSVSGGAVRLDSRQVGLDKVAVATLDANARVSGSFVFKNSSVDLALAEGYAGEKLVRWALERAALPARLEPRTPLRFAARRIAWAPKGALEADARIEFQDGPAIGLDLASHEKLLELRRVTIKDAQSDAALSAAVAAERIQASFSGTLHGRSIAAMLARPPADSGVVQGDFRATVDRARPQDSIGEGRLQINALDLTWLAGTQALIERASLTAEPDGLRILEARFSWADQQFTLRGEGRRTKQGPVIDARLESPGIDFERLRPKPDKAKKPEKPSAIWPLPVTGRIEVRSGFVQFKRHRVEPFDGILTLESQRARLEVKEARTCGVSFPLEFEATPKEMSLEAHLSMRNEPLEKSMHCLTGGTIALTGNMDLTAELKTTGPQPNLVRNLTGTAQAEARDGRLNKFAFIGNILAFRGISSLEEMNQEGFRYRRMTAKGRFERGEFLLDEGFFDSDAVRLASTGRVDLQGADSQLTVLVALLSRVERVVGAIPILGDVFGGTMLAVPVALHGDIRNPTVVPLGPRAITDQLLGIFERTLKIPGKLVVPPEEPKPKP